MEICIEPYISRRHVSVLTFRRDGRHSKISIPGHMRQSQLLDWSSNSWRPNGEYHAWPNSPMDLWLPMDWAQLVIFGCNFLFEIYNQSNWVL